MNLKFSYTFLIVTLSIVIAVVVGGVGGFLHLKYKDDIEKLDALNKESQDFNEKNAKFNQIKLDIALLNEYISEMALLYEEVASQQTTKMSEILDLWVKCEDLIKDLESHNEHFYSDEFHSKFNELIDAIFALENEHKKLKRAIQRGETIELMSKHHDLIVEINNHYLDLLQFDLSEGDENEYKPLKGVKGLSPILLWLFLIGVVALIFIITYYILALIKSPVNKLGDYLKSLREGDLPEEVILANVGYENIELSLNYLVRKLLDIKNFALQVGEGNFDNHEIIEFKEDGELGTAFYKMQQSLEQVANEDIRRTHINQGLAKFSEILSNNTNNLAKFGDEVVLNLVMFLKANQGALFVVNDDNKESEYMELVAGYAFNKKKYLDMKIVRGQGLVGQVWQEGKRVYMTEIPENYITITSGLGYSTPRCILIVPLIFNEVVQGVIELASFSKLKDYELGFVEKVSESISSALSSVKINTKTQYLLGQSKELTEKMKVQEDEMRKKVNELRITQEESQRREEQYLREIRRLRKRLEEYERNF